MATVGLGTKEREAVEAFRRDVIEPSMTSIVILDFWAEWCGPCKALAPILDKVVAEYAPRVTLAKINVDENRVIAEQFRVQSIPTVYAIFQGRPVADLTPARTERELKHYLDQLLKQLPVAADGEPEEDITGLVEMGQAVLAEGDAERALSIFSQIDEMAPGTPAVVAGLAQALLALGRAEEAAQRLDGLTEDAAKDPAAARVRAALALAAETAPVDDLAALAARLATDPDDHAARFELAGGQMAAGDRDGAADSLLEIIHRDREWNDGAARQRLLKMLDAAGFDDPWAAAQRRKLSVILFS